MIMNIENKNTPIEKFMFFFQISFDSLAESLKLLGYNSAIRESFIECYKSKANDLQKTLTRDLALSLPSYKSLNWRFDVQVNSLH